jgi:hypothetical protein
VTLLHATYALSGLLLLSAAAFFHATSPRRKRRPLVMVEVWQGSSVRNVNTPTAWRRK